MSISLITLITFCVSVLANANTNVDFSIRYYDKKIYYPGDEINLKITISNPSNSENTDTTFYLSDNPIQSFGFNLNHLNGEQVEPALSFASSLANKSSYQVVNLKSGQEISITVALGKWLNIFSPGQYRLHGYFYPKLRGKDNRVIQSDSFLDITVLPETNDRWQNELTEEIRSVLISRNLSPWEIVKETLENRKMNRNHRTALYFDLNSLSGILTKFPDAESLKRTISRGSWLNIPGFAHPYNSAELLSSQITQTEAQVKVAVEYNPFGQLYSRNLRFYFHRENGYWMIRRIDNFEEDSDAVYLYGKSNPNPSEIILLILNAIEKGDWEIALRYFDVEFIVRNLPEYIDRWNRLDAAEHSRVIEKYKKDLIAGYLDNTYLPLNEIEDWKITNVTYGQNEGSIVVENIKTYSDSDIPITQTNEYVFYLRKPEQSNQWKIIRYQTSILRRK